MRINERSKLINELVKYNVWSFKQLCNKETRELEQLIQCVNIVIDVVGETIRESINNELA